ncbi:MAG: hypothetical protein V4543_13060 [Bacteroidota bacterium]
MTPLYLFAEAFIFVSAAWAVYRFGGLQRHAAFGFCMLIYFFLLFFTPACNYLLHTQTLNGISYAAYTEKGLSIYCLGLAAFTGIYFYTARNLPLFMLPQLLRKLVRTKAIHRRLQLLFWLFLFIMLLNIQLGGADLAAVFNFKTRNVQGIIFRSHNFSGWLEASNTCLVSVLILAAVYGIPRSRILFWSLITGFFFLFSGLRYRLILVLMGWSLNWFMKLGFSRRNILKITTFTFLAVISLQYLTINRWAIAKRRWEYLTPDITRFSIRTLLTETNNSQVFFCVLKYRDENNEPFDLGKGMFGGIITRAIPASFFPKGLKPLPRSLEVVIAATKPPDQRNGIGALSNIDEYYTSFGYPGVVVFMGLLAYFLARMPVPMTEKISAVHKADMIQENSILNEQTDTLALYAILVPGLFQLLTRGYFPQQFELYVFLLLPLFLLKMLPGKQSA